MPYLPYVGTGKHKYFHPNNSKVIRAGVDQQRLTEPLHRHWTVVECSKDYRYIDHIIVSMKEHLAKEEI